MLSGQASGIHFSSQNGNAASLFSLPFFLAVGADLEELFMAAWVPGGDFYSFQEEFVCFSFLKYTPCHYMQLCDPVFSLLSWPCYRNQGKSTGIIAVMYLKQLQLFIFP